MPDGAIVDKFVAWKTETYNSTEGLDFDGDEALKVFSFVVDFDTTNAFWDQDTNGAPNTLGGPMTFFFGSVLRTAGGSPTNYDYQGNLVLTPIPEPSTLTLLSIAAIGLLAYAWRRRRS